MIDEKKLIEEIPEWLNPNCVGEEEYHKGWNECNKYWCNTIKSQPKVGEWIPVGEELPSDGQWVMVFSKSNVDDDWDVPSIVQYMGDGIWRWNTLIPVSDDVIAWQPLPEPYKKGEQE